MKKTNYLIVITLGSLLYSCAGIISENDRSVANTKGNETGNPVTRSCLSVLENHEAIIQSNRNVVVQNISNLMDLRAKSLYEEYSRKINFREKTFVSDIEKARKNCVETDIDKTDDLLKTVRAEIFNPSLFTEVINDSIKVNEACIKLNKLIKLDGKNLYSVAQTTTLGEYKVDIFKFYSGQEVSLSESDKTSFINVMTDFKAIEKIYNHEQYLKLNCTNSKDKPSAKYDKKSNTLILKFIKNSNKLKYAIPDLQNIKKAIGE